MTERATAALLTNLLLKLSTAARALREPDPVGDPGHQLLSAPLQIIDHDDNTPIAPILVAMRQAADRLGGHAAMINVATLEIATGSGLGRGGTLHAIDSAAAELRSRSAFVSGAAQSLEAAIANAALAIAELARAISAVHPPSLADSDAGLLAQDVHRASTRLVETTQHINEIVDFIDKVALQSNLMALGTVVDTAQDGDRVDGGLKLVAGQVHALAMETDQVTSDIQALVETIIAGARDARLAIVEAHAALKSLGGTVQSAQHSISSTGGT